MIYLLCIKMGEDDKLIFSRWEWKYRTSTLKEEKCHSLLNERISSWHIFNKSLKKNIEYKNHRYEEKRWKNLRI